jgi:hypothetical protein
VHLVRSPFTVQEATPVLALLVIDGASDWAGL